MSLFVSSNRSSVPEFFHLSTLRRLAVSWSSTYDWQRMAYFSALTLKNNRCMTSISLSVSGAPLDPETCPGAPSAGDAHLLLKELGCTSVLHLTNLSLVNSMLVVNPHNIHHLLNLTSLELRQIPLGSRLSTFWQQLQMHSIHLRKLVVADCPPGPCYFEYLQSYAGLEILNLMDHPPHESHERTSQVIGSIVRRHSATLVELSFRNNYSNVADGGVPWQLQEDTIEGLRCCKGLRSLSLTWIPTTGGIDLVRISHFRKFIALNYQSLGFFDPPFVDLSAFAIIQRPIGVFCLEFFA